MWPSVWFRGGDLELTSFVVVENELYLPIRRRAESTISVIDIRDGTSLRTFKISQDFDPYGVTYYNGDLVVVDSRHNQVYAIEVF